jgi:hypothetical protein
MILCCAQGEHIPERYDSSMFCSARCGDAFDADLARGGLNDESVDEEWW